ncbi:hypothetical protein H9P43_005480 [Blastocladiella emersonii ATCC 22665]|nr:hypothetical protein H9P43_005480 [Blastocladiella emersonii ATCC 22665]
MTCSKDLKRAAVRMHRVKGLPVRRVSDRLEVSQGSVSEWSRLVDVLGEDTFGPRRHARQSKLGPDDYIIDFLHIRSTTTLRELVALLNFERRKDVSQQTVWRALKRANFSFKALKMRGANFNAEHMMMKDYMS